jgi:hypothetical protein
MAEGYRGELPWNLELLISGGAIFSLLQFPDLLIDAKFTLSITSRLAGTNLFLILGMLSVKLLTIGFVAYKIVIR